MIKNLNKVDIRGISIMSTGCNLNCEYCNIVRANHTSNYKNYLKDTKESILNGQYLKNIILSLQRLKQSTENIINFEIWGQEPTLILKELTEKWEDWYQTFFNITKMGLSSNGVGFTEDLCNFIKKVDETAKQPIEFAVQFSYDGEYSNELNARGTKNDTVIKNIKYFINELNQYHFKNVSIRFNLHSVLSMQLVDSLDTYDKIHNYFTNYDNLMIELLDCITNKNIMYKANDFILQNSGKFTTEYGLRVTEFLNKVDTLNSQHHYKSINAWGSRRFSTYSMGSIAPDMIKLLEGSNIYNLDEYIDKFLSYDKNIRDKVRKPLCMCSTLLGYLRVLPDGTVVDCHASIYDTFIDKNLISDSIYDLSRYYCNKFGRYPNLVTGTDEEIDKIIEFYERTSNDATMIAMYHESVIIMYLMAIAGQISQDYLKDFNKLKRHAFILCRWGQCYTALKVLNGSVLSRGNEEYRYMCNGVMDFVEKYINEELQRIKENRILNGKI